MVYGRPKLECNIPIWSPYLIKNINHLEPVQRWYNWLVCNHCNIANTSYLERLVKLNLKSLKYRRLIFNFIQQLIDSLRQQMFHYYNNRSSGQKWMFIENRVSASELMVFGVSFLYLDVTISNSTLLYFSTSILYKACSFVCHDNNFAYLFKFI